MNETITQPPTVHYSIRIDRKILDDLRIEAKRQDRSVAWMIEHYSKIGMAKDRENSSAK